MQYVCIDVLLIQPVSSLVSNNTKKIETAIPRGCTHKKELELSYKTKKFHVFFPQNRSLGT